MKALIKSTLSKYDSGTFYLTASSILKEQCNAPADKGGLYIVYDAKDIIYIGRSGRLKDGKPIIRKGGLFDRLVNGRHALFNKVARRKSWIQQIEKEKIKQLKVVWYAFTINKANNPTVIESVLIEGYKAKHNGNKPRWHK